jgi:GalNAc-alpha-(1->4)-GalNAc-alpha-(1->3)-diNAcBac-PP-undecaprenol alpha-1,4-N-acetyl-D-galactosaminyltransferase
MQLTLVISSLQGGGAERVMTNMANHWAAKQWNITLLTFDDGAIPPFYKLDSRVRHIPLAVARQSENIQSALRNSVNRVWALRRAICDSRPDAVISFMDKTNVATLLATRGSNVPVIASERIDPGRQPIGKLWERLRRVTYTWADLIIVQSDAALKYFPASLQARAQVIPNPVLLPPRYRSSKAVNNSLLISVGRLDHQKGFDLLLRAFASVRERHNEWALTILGEGPKRRELESLKNELGLDECVFLPGRVEDVYQHLAQADLFVMPSRYEGFPNALCEAMSCGLPAISTDCPSGPRDIINDGINGILVANEDVTSLAEAMDRLMGSEVERNRLAERAFEVTSRFALEKIMELWEDALVLVKWQRQATPIASRRLLADEPEIKSAFNVIDQ